MCWPGSLRYVWPGLPALAGFTLPAGIGALRYVWPLVLLIIGYMFITHPQQCTDEAAAKAVRDHRILGSIFLLAGMARGSAVLTNSDVPVFVFAWIILVLVAALELIFYSEPEGALETGYTGH